MQRCKDSTRAAREKTGISFTITTEILFIVLSPQATQSQSLLAAAAAAAAVAVAGGMAAGTCAVRRITAPDIITSTSRGPEYGRLGHIRCHAFQSTSHFQHIVNGFQQPAHTKNTRFWNQPQRRVVFKIGIELSKRLLQTHRVESERWMRVKAGGDAHDMRKEGGAHDPGFCSGRASGTVVSCWR